MTTSDEQRRAYLHKHRIEQQITAAVTKVLVKRPSKPVAEIGRCMLDPDHDVPAGKAFTPALQYVQDDSMVHEISLPESSGWMHLGWRMGMGNRIVKLRVGYLAVGTENVGVRGCPYGICCPWVRWGWGLDGLGKFFRRRRRRRCLPWTRFPPMFSTFAICFAPQKSISAEIIVITTNGNS